MITLLDSTLGGHRFTAVIVANPGDARGVADYQVDGVSIARGDWELLLRLARDFADGREEVFRV